VEEVVARKWAQAITKLGFFLVFFPLLSFLLPKEVLVELKRTSWLKLP